VQKVLQNLLELQSVDGRLADVRARLGRIPKKLAECDGRVASAKAELDTAKAAQLATIKDRKKYELDVEQHKERVKRYRDQMSQVKTNEAYKALQHEVQMAEEEIAKAEDRLLEQMVNAEEYDRRVKAGEKAVKQAEEDAKGERAGIERDRSELGKELAAAEAERAKVVGDIPENLLDHYARIVKKHNGVALAEVRNEKCGACGMIVRPHVFQEMRREGNDKMFHCETCTRILYMSEATFQSISDNSTAAAASSAAGSSSNSSSTPNSSNTPAE
jgi:predicted  nucleic acid-binding Zn-ribbon protein